MALSCDRFPVSERFGVELKSLAGLAVTSIAVDPSAQHSVGPLFCLDVADSTVRGLILVTANTVRKSDCCDRGPLCSDIRHEKVPFGC